MNKIIDGALYYFSTIVGYLSVKLSKLLLSRKQNSAVILSKDFLLTSNGILITKFYQLTSYELVSNGLQNLVESKWLWFNYLLDGIHIGFSGETDALFVFQPNELSAIYKLMSDDYDVVKLELIKTLMECGYSYEEAENYQSYAMHDGAIPYTADEGE